MDKKSLKLLKSPDLLQKKFYAGVDWALHNRQRVISLLAAVVFVIAASVGVWWFRKSQTEGRQQALFAIDEAYYQEEMDAFKKREALQKELTALEDENKKAGDKVTPEKNANLESKKKAVEEVKADHSKTAENYVTFYRQHSATVEGTKAGMTAVQNLIKEDKFQEAADILSQILTNPDKSEFYQIQVRTLYVSVLEELGKFDVAAQEADKLIEISVDDFKPKALLIKGRLELLAGKRENAEQIFDKLVTEFGSSPEAVKARAIKSVWK